MPTLHCPYYIYYLIPLYIKIIATFGGLFDFPDYGLSDD
jgi:hypothetical protein